MSECILTTYERSAGGYGRIHRGGKKILHHRLAYCEANRLSLEDIADKCVMHTCDNPGCVNPEHLVLGTHADNMQDSASKGRKRGELAGRSKLTEAEVIAIRTNPLKLLQRELAAKYGVSLPTIKDIVARKIWRHI